MSDNLPHMDYRQHRRARRLVHECCNYDEGNCLLLDDGEPCVCVQSISFSLMCHWFRVAVLPLDGELAAALLCRGSRKRGGFSAPNRLYVKVPPVPQVQFSDQLMAGSPPLIEPENRPTDGQKTDLMMVGKPSPNQTTINNLTENQTMGASGEPPAAFGRYQNIFLSQTEYDELQAEYPDRLERFIEEMSRYLAANGKTYQNYAAALRIWADNDKKGAGTGLPDYSCEEGESL